MDSFFKLIFNNDFENNINIASDFFYKNIFDKESRPDLWGKKIFIEAHEFVDKRPYGFWHLVSLDDNHHYKNLFPCNNDITISLCNYNCLYCTHKIVLRYSTETRYLCLYRASMLPWINEIIKLANIYDKRISFWKVPQPKQKSKVYLRYKYNQDDYIIILSDESKFYRVIAAYPVFLKNEKERFDKDEIKYIK